jgi:hypothetical protein
MPKPSEPAPKHAAPAYEPSDKTPTKTKRQPKPSDIVWGAADIGRVIGISERAAFHLLENKKLKSAKKVGGRHCGSRAKLLEECGA